MTLAMRPPTPSAPACPAAPEPPTAWLFAIVLLLIVNVPPYQFSIPPPSPKPASGPVSPAPPTAWLLVMVRLLAITVLGFAPGAVPAVGVQLELLMAPPWPQPAMKLWPLP